MRKKRTYIILILVLIIFFIIMFYFFGYDELKEKRNAAILIFGEETIWSYNNKKWVNIKKEESIQKLNWQKYHVFTNGKKIGDYYLWHDDMWYAFDNKKNAVSLEGDLFAYRSNYNIDIFKFKKEQIADNDPYVSEVLENKDIELGKFTSQFKVSFDFDNDGELEEFYVISNAFAYDFEPDTVFSIVFMVKDDNIYDIYENIASNDSFNGCKPYFQTFLDINADSSSEFVLSCGYYSNNKRSDMLYHFVDGKFKILISN